MAGSLDTLKQKMALTYKNTMLEDGTLDFFDPSVEALLLPFMANAQPRPNEELAAKRFREYFSTNNADFERAAATTTNEPWPTLVNPCGRPLDAWSIPRPCLRVDGARGTFGNGREGFRFTQLFAGDVVWLFFHERMGVHRMIGAILDDFVTKGRFPIRPGSYEGVMIEAMVREVKSGLSSTVRDRDTTYRRVLGWTSDAGAKLDGQSAPKNETFSVTFHRLIELALGYYNEKRLASAIQSSITVGKPSIATLTTIRDTIAELRKAFDPFKYGRNHTHTLMGIVWTIAGLDLLSRLRTQLGIPEPYDRADELVPAAYDLLLGGGDRMNGNRYTAHRDCAVSGRDIMLDVQAMDMEGPAPPENEELAAWLDEVERKFENYRTAYRVLTGQDLGATRVSIIQAA
jgi:hypothetical protein